MLLCSPQVDLDGRRGAGTQRPFVVIWQSIGLSGWGWGPRDHLLSDRLCSVVHRSAWMGLEPGGYLSSPDWLCSVGQRLMRIAWEFLKWLGFFYRGFNVFLCLLYEAHKQGGVEMVHARASVTACKLDPLWWIKKCITVSVIKMLVNTLYKEPTFLLIEFLFRFDFASMGGKTAG